MHVISKWPFLEAMKKYPAHARAIIATYNVLNKGEFRSPEALRAVFKTLDNFKYKDKWWVIDISGNHLRLMAFIEFRFNRVFVKHIVTYAEYEERAHVSHCRSHSRD